MSRARETMLPLVVCACLALLPTYPFVLQGKTPAPVDHAHRFAPWYQPQPDYRRDILQMDGALQFLPWRDYMLEVERSGEVPLWNPYTFLGVPFLANSQSAPLYPLHLIWAATPFSAEALLRFSAWFHLFVAGLGMFLFVRCLRGPPMGAMLAAASFQLSAFLVGWLELPSVLMTASWIPWCLWGTLRVWDQGARSLPSLSTIGLMWLAGHAQIAAFGTMAVLLLLAWLALFDRHARKPSAVLLGIVLGAFLAAPQVLPVLEAGRSGHRAAAPTEEGWIGYTAQALGVKHLAPLVTPSVFGLPHMGSTSEPELTSYWLALEEPGRHYAELAFYVGPVIPVLALFGLGSLAGRRRVGFNYLLVAFGISIALGTFVAKALYFLVPGWSATGSPGRAAILVSVGLCAAAGCAIRDDDTSSSPPAAWAVVCVVGAALAAWLATTVRPNVEEFLPLAERFGAMTRLFAGAFVLSAVFVAASVWLRFRGATLWAPLFAVSVGLLFLAHDGINPATESGLYKQPHPLLDSMRGEKVAVVNDGWSLLRAAPGGVAPPNTLLPYRIATADGYDSLIPRVTKEALDAVNGRDSAPAANGNILFIRPSFDPSALAALGVDYVLSTREHPLPLVRSEGGVNVYRLGDGENSPVQSASATTLTLRPDHPNAASYRSRLPSGWEEVAEGKLVYRPVAFRLGVLLCGVGILALFAISYRRNGVES
jgi:hypothetical protein